MIKYKEFKIYQRKPSVMEFKKLRNSVGWDILNDKKLKESLSCSPYCMCAYNSDDIIGMVRITGDKTMYGYIQDFIVIPEYQQKGIGKKILELLLKNINKKGYLIGVCPSECSTEIYQSFGFKKRPENPNGFMYVEVGDV